MKKSTKVLIATTAFAAALNLTACTYGPPPDYQPSSSQSAAANEETAGQTPARTEEGEGAHVE